MTGNARFLIKTNNQQLKQKIQSPKGKA